MFMAELNVGLRIDQFSAKKSGVRTEFKMIVKGHVVIMARSMIKVKALKERLLIYFSRNVPQKPRWRARQTSLLLTNKIACKQYDR
jgi:hypothetical protein